MYEVCYDNPMFYECIIYFIKRCEHIKSNLTIKERHTVVHNGNRNLSSDRTVVHIGEVTVSHSCTGKKIRVHEYACVV